MSVRSQFNSSRLLWLGIAACGVGMLAFAGCDGAPVNDRKPTESFEVAAQDLPKKPNPDARVLDVTDDSFEEDVLKSQLPVVVEFGAVWCGPCQMMQPMIRELASEFHGKVRFCKVDVDQSPRISDKFVGGGGIPLLTVFKKGEVIARQPGYSPTLKDAVTKFLNRIDQLPEKKADKAEATSDPKQKSSEASKSGEPTADEQKKDSQSDQKPSSEPDKK